MPNPIIQTNRFRQPSELPDLLSFNDLQESSASLDCERQFQDSPFIVLRFDSFRFTVGISFLDIRCQFR